MPQLFGPQPLAIGLDVGSESVKMLQLAATATGLVVAAALRAVIPDAVRGDPDRRVAFAGETLRAALRQRRFRGRQVVAALPKDVVHYKTHRLPPMPAADVMLAARIDARDLFRFDPDSADVQCLDAGDVRQGVDRRREVILVAAGKRYVDEFVWAIHRAGGRASSLEIEPSAVRRAAARVGEAAGDGAPPRLLLDVGAAQSRVVIFAGEQVRVLDAIDVGADHLRTAVSRKLGLPAAEAEQLRRRAAAQAAGGQPSGAVSEVVFDATRHAAETIARGVVECVRYHATTFRGPAPARLELVGGAGDDPQLRSILSDALALPAAPLDLFTGIDARAIAPADRTPSLGGWAVALGLALKGAPAPRFDSRLEADSSVAAGSPAVEPAREPEVAVVRARSGDAEGWR
jgi:type IV pilus assembly protein PilM